MTVWGIHLSLHLKRRTSLLEKTVLMLESMKLDFEYLALPLDEMIYKYSDSQPYLSINFIHECCRKLRSGLDFPSAWSGSVKTTSLYTSEEKDKLLQLGSILGTSDCGGQISMLEMYIGYFNQFLKNARSKSENYSGMCVYLGVFCGIGMFVLLI
ncbi:MAG: stage III sporulation protein AB [Ruminococcus sp.]|nr:stage III sporulation protein AB [Ruminococcus sp.]